MTLLVMLLTTATAWADGVKYLDEYGVELTCTSYTVLTNQTDISTPLPAGWYVVESSVSYNSELSFTGDTHLILADGAVVSITAGDGCGIDVAGYSLNIYGQTNGTGSLTTNNGEIGIYAKNIYIYGGSISATNAEYGLYAITDINIYGGNCTTYDCDRGVYSNGGSIIIYGGTVNASGDVYGIGVSGENNTITLNGGIVTASEYKEGMVTIGNGLVYSDGTNNDIKGTISNVSDIATKTLSLYGYSYLDENGYEQTCSEYIMLTNGTDISSALGTSDNETWYVVKGNVCYNDILHFIGDTHLILADDAYFTINGYWCGIEVQESGKESNITIYAQSTGDNKGKVEIEAETGIYVYYGSLTINGGNIIANGYDSGINITYGGIIINGGTINASGTEGYGICTSTYDDTNCDIIINGGTIIATGEEEGINGGGDIIINGGNIESNSDYGGIKANGAITLNGGTVIASSFSGTINYKLTASLADGNYWSTFYFGSMGFTIDEGVDACAYTATYGLNSGTNEYELTLNKLGEDGKDIPQGTAVIIVSSTASVSLTSNSSLDTFSGSNSLHGVDVRTDMSTLVGSSSDNIYVMGKKDNNFGFFKYTGAYMPAHKAYLRINSSNEALARGITMVFENSTGIKSIDKAQIGTESDAWYSLDGRKLLVKPTTKGVYINNGNKVIIK